MLSETFENYFVKIKTLKVFFSFQNNKKTTGNIKLFIVFTVGCNTIKDLKCYIDSQKTQRKFFLKP